MDMETLKWIKSHFRLDENRLYIIGESNGGFATYAIAQNHPHLAAAIFPCAGYPQLETIENIAGIPTYQVVSPRDYIFAGRENTVKDKLRRYRYYHQIDFKEMNHHHLEAYLCQKEILRELFQHKRNPYPDTLRFKTFRNRHGE